MIRWGKWHVFALTVLALVLVLHPVSEGGAQSEAKLSSGQTVYVPAYSHIFSGDAKRPFYLTVTLSIRNTDIRRPISLMTVDYYDSQGKLLKRYLTTPLRIEPMGTTEYVVEELDKSGGAGANFVVRWKSEQLVNAPLMEAVMISTRSQQGISFTSRGRVIKED
jgi:hypothetical protein